MKRESPRASGKRVEISTNSTFACFSFPRGGNRLPLARRQCPRHVPTQIDKNLALFLRSFESFTVIRSRPHKSQVKAHSSPPATRCAMTMYLELSSLLSLLPKLLYRQRLTGTCRQHESEYEDDQSLCSHCQWVIKRPLFYKVYSLVGCS